MDKLSSSVAGGIYVLLGFRRYCVVDRGGGVEKEKEKELTFQQPLLQCLSVVALWRQKYGERERQYISTIY